MKTCTTYGLNLVDPSATEYQGWGGALRAAVADAVSLATLAGLHDVPARSYLALYVGESDDSFAQLPPYRLVADATREEWIARHRELAASARPGDLFIFTYSGHGGQERYMLQTRETFCFYDGELSDDEQHALMALFPAGVNLVYLLDCCHAGGMDRFKAGDFIGARKARERLRASQRPPLTRDALLANVILLCACQRDESALDGQYNGAFTASLLATMQAALLAKETLTWCEWFERTEQFMTERFPQQHPAAKLLGPNTAVLWQQPAFTA